MWQSCIKCHWLINSLVPYTKWSYKVSLGPRDWFHLIVLCSSQMSVTRLVNWLVPWHRRLHLFFSLRLWERREMPICCSMRQDPLISIVNKQTVSTPQIVTRSQLFSMTINQFNQYLPHFASVTILLIPAPAAPYCLCSQSVQDMISTFKKIIPDFPGAASTLGI